MNGSNTRWYHVYAGMTGDAANPPRVPAVWVDVTTVTPDRCTIDVRTVGDFTDRDAGGALRITAVDGSVVHLQATSGRRLAFDLSTDRFTG